MRGPLPPPGPPHGPKGPRTPGTPPLGAPTPCRTPLFHRQSRCGGHHAAYLSKDVIKADLRLGTRKNFCASFGPSCNWLAKGQQKRSIWYPIPHHYCTTGAVQLTLLWRFASGLRVVSGAGFLALGFHRSQSQGGVWDRWQTISLLCLTAVSLATNASNAVGLGGSQAFSLYIGSLVIGLVSSGLLFLAVAGSVLRGDQQ